MKRMFCLAAVVLGCSAASWAAEFYVSPTGNDGNAGTSWGTAVLTVAKGVELASDNDNVNLAAGTYAAAASVDVNKKVNIVGPNAAKTGYDLTRAAEAILSAPAAPAIKLTVAGGTIKGITAQNTPSTEDHATNAMTAVVLGNAADVVIENNIVVGQPASSGALGPNGIVAFNAANALVKGNLVKDVLTTNRSCIKIQSCTAGQALNNQVTNTAYNGIAFDSSAGGIAQGNTADTCAQPGIQVANGAVYTVVSNVVTGCNTALGADKGGIAVATGATDVKVQYNRLTGNGKAAVAFRNVASVLGSATEVSYNNFLGNNLVGVFMGRQGELSAPNNYWNAAGGPAASGADAVAIGANGGTVNSTPFATAQVPNASVAGWTAY